MEIDEIQESNYFFIQGNSAHGFGPAISLPIATLEKTESLTKELFSSLCGLINQTTLTTLYPSGCGRSNHDGTHSARQARILEALFEEIEKGPKKELAESLSEEEKTHLTLAAYLLRSGRIDDSSHMDINPDDYNTRSAMIYEAYAKQFVVSSETVSWVKNLIINSCKSVWARDPEIDGNPKSKFAWDCLTTVHELDLVRCFNKFDIDMRIKLNVQNRMDPYFEEGTVNKVVKKFFEFSKTLCEVTGCARTYDYHPGNASLFLECSQDGRKCWDIVSEQNLEVFSWKF